MLIVLSLLSTELMSLDEHSPSRKQSVRDLALPPLVSILALLKLVVAAVLVLRTGTVTADVTIIVALTIVPDMTIPTVALVTKNDLTTVTVITVVETVMIVGTVAIVVLTVALTVVLALSVAVTVVKDILPSTTTEIDTLLATIATAMKDATLEVVKIVTDTEMTANATPLLFLLLTDTAKGKTIVLKPSTYLSAQKN